MTNDYGTPIREQENLQIGELLTILYRQKLVVLSLAVLTSLITLFWIAAQDPLYQARATLLLEQDEAAGGVLSELASLTSDPRAEAEIALIQSRSLASVTVAEGANTHPPAEMFVPTEPDFDPFARATDTGPDPAAMERMGLDCLVEPHDLRPLASLTRRLLGDSAQRHRLRARITPEPGAADRPPALDLWFSEQDQAGQHVCVAPHDGYLRPGKSEARELPYESGVPFEAFGWRLQLWPSGDTKGQRYTLQWLPEEAAIKRFMESVTAEESGRKTNVVFVSVSDSDPQRAAESANALAKNYIRRSVRIGQQKATRTVSFINGQLEEQLAALAEAEREVVRLQTLHPETIAISVSASALIEQAGSLALQRAQAELAQQSLAEALALLQAGDLGSLARLGPEVPNLLALGYLEQLALLDAEALRLERTDVAGFKALLQAEHFRLQTMVDEADLRITSLEHASQAIEREDPGAPAQLAAFPEFGPHLGELAKLDGELSRMGAAAKSDNPLLRSLHASRAQLVQRLSAQLLGTLEAARASRTAFRDLAGTYEQSLERWPTQERSNIDDARAALAESITDNLRSQLDGVESSLAALDQQAAAIDERLGALPKAELLLAEPMRQRVARTRIVEFLLSSQQEAGITAAATSAAAVLIDPATPPPSRVFPRTGLTMIFGALAGLLLGCAAALLRNRLRSALHTEAEVERCTDLPVLGSVPSFTAGKTRIEGAKRNSRFVPLFDAPNGPQSEAYRQIRASLRLALPKDNALRTLAATSCIPGEGKTVTNVDLALAFAETGQRVLLVDGDLRKPRVHDVFEIDRGPGFAEVLESGEDWRGLVKEGLMGSIDVLPAGHCKGRPGEVLACPAVRPAVEAFMAEYDLVVFDLPPAVVVADVMNFASQLDALVLLYRCGGVPGRLLDAATTRLRRAGVHLAGVVLNAVVARAGPGGYGYGYGQTYGYGEAPDEFRKAS